MAAPDRVYRYFTNLKSKNTTDLFHIRTAKPLASYITVTPATPQQQVEQLKALFKVDGILWVKNPDVPKQTTDADKTVEIEDPEHPGQTITIEDPDLGDSNRDGFIAYIYPHGANGVFHDLDTQPKSGITGATDYSERIWSRASKFRYRKNGDSEDAIILNDAGLNRRGDAAVISNDITAYIYNASNTGLPRFNDVKVPVDFWSTTYNRLYHTYVYIAQSTASQYTLIGDGGIIPKLDAGVANNNATRRIKFISRVNPNTTDPDYTKLLDLSSVPLATVVSGAADMDHDVTVTVPSYKFKAVAVNEEGEKESAVSSDIAFGLYRWNMDDSINFGNAANNSDTDRISVSHASPEVSISRYNSCLPAVTKQFNYNALYADSDPTPNSSDTVLLIYTKTDNFIHDGSSPIRDGNVTIDDLAFFYDESSVDATSMRYTPLVTGAYILGNHTDQTSTFLTMKGAVNNNQGVYCFQYTAYPQEGNFLAIQRYWQLAYDGTNWYYPGASDNTNVQLEVDLLDSQNNLVTMLEENTAYTIRVRLFNFTVGKTFTITYSTNTSGVARFEDAGGNIISSPYTTSAVTAQTASPEYTAIKLDRVASNISLKSIITITVNYTKYNDMLNPEVAASKTEQEISYGYSSSISGFIVLNYVSSYNVYTDGVYTSPSDILSVTLNPLDTVSPGNDVTYFVRASDGKLCTDSSVSTLVPQGFYISNCNPAVTPPTYDTIYYVDAGSIPAALEH